MTEILHSQPWWTEFIVKVGSWCALALFLVAAMFGWLRTPISDKLDSIQITMKGQADRQEYMMWQISAILRAICYNQDNLDKNVKMNCDPWKIQGVTP